MNGKVSVVMLSNFVKVDGLDESKGTMEDVKVQDDLVEYMVHKSL